METRHIGDSFRKGIGGHSPKTKPSLTNLPDVWAKPSS